MTKKAIGAFLAGAGLALLQPKKEGSTKTLPMVSEKLKTESFIPFWISFSQLITIGGVWENHAVVYGPYKEEEAHAAFERLKKYFLGFGTGKEFKNPSYPMGKMEFLKKTVFQGNPIFDPYMMFLTKSWGKRIILEEDVFISPGETLLYFDLFSSHPDMDLAGTSFVGTTDWYGKGTEIQIEPKEHLDYWQATMLPNIQKNWKFS